jgi:hypothetical protein
MRIENRRAEIAPESETVKTIDPGHIYLLDVLDIEVDQPQSTETLMFVKRQGPLYPGNISHFPGTNCQEVLRALIDRVKFLNSQIPDNRNQPIVRHLREALWLFESRAAQRDGRAFPALDEFECIETEPSCPGCAHIRCSGKCGRS